MPVRIQLRRGTSAQWVSSNPILAQGEMGLELDTGKFKFGDGSTPWILLNYPASQYLMGLNDVQAVSLDDGAVLVYDISINKWVPQTQLNKQSMDGGFF